ncbi:hydroxymethylpyrimidine/phosphomethylpyrimidine kinase [uncultured Polaribacter sp.]|uniref:hydroxymethylpyrimidine/phosphomethylpyrimidine kinase n=1 Tax=uncultured Polaribacter sp. TaxID=174711 RepID=UPI002634A9CC|nr:hydroxymethylpyrimidine/phosphomethylpyrimidine kinase [uncultured Polaribacter sp.]
MEESSIDNCTLPIDNCILTIAGHDPSGGAGITSDIKTFEAHGLYGLSVCTAITVQNDVEFNQCIWTDVEFIINQIEILFKRFKISVVKIGLVASWEVLEKIVICLKNIDKTIKIIVDPIIKASAGFDFHSTENQNRLDAILKECYLITPNYNEIQQLYPKLNIEDTITHISSLTNMYLKGGHRIDKKGVDELYYNKLIQVNILPLATSISEKHGSGCVLSSALASAIALENNLEDACKSAKYYTEAFLNSNTSLLGTHNYCKN